MAKEPSPRFELVTTDTDVATDTATSRSGELDSSPDESAFGDATTWSNAGVWPPIGLDGAESPGGDAVWSADQPVVVDGDAVAGGVGQ
jgi:hypothetical protein